MNFKPDGANQDALNEPGTSLTYYSDNFEGSTTFITSKTAILIAPKNCN
jgi:hypothetical protein